jgi:hypothetical protein
MTTTPGERISELARLLVDERMAQARATESAVERQGMEFLAKIAGLDMSEAAQAERLLKEPVIWIAAIIAYLEETVKEK